VLSRATLLGRAVPLEAEKAAELKALFATAHRSLTGVDAVRDDDLFVRLHVDRVFFVCGLRSVRGAQRLLSRLALTALAFRMRRLRLSRATRIGRPRRIRCGGWRLIWCAR
jgi:hypothetical protein